MLTTLAVSGYRSLRDIVLPLGALTLVRGANGSGKSSLYKSLHLLSEAAQGRLISSLAHEGGLHSVLWAGPESFSRDMKSGAAPVQGTARKGPISLRMGFASDDFGYAIDLGLEGGGGEFELDPAIKAEALWTGQVMRPSAVFAERKGPYVKLRSSDDGTWQDRLFDLSSFDSMMTQAADPREAVELLLVRERMRDWRFYDQLRTDADAPSRRPQVLTYTPVMSGDGSDIAAAIKTIYAVGEGEMLSDAVEDAFAGSELSVSGSEHGIVTMRQPGMLRPLRANELSDGTLRYLLLLSALLTPRPPEIMVLNEPEASLHPSLIAPLGRLLRTASERMQIVVVSHNDDLMHALRQDVDLVEIELSKRLGETVAEDCGAPSWNWLNR